MFSGPRAVLRPVYHQLLKLALSLGKDVKACPGKTIVPLGGYAKKDRIMRRIGVKSKADIDDDLKRWLRKAWERDA